MKNSSGIYCIENSINKKKFIGQTINFRLRWNSHKCMLRKNKHGNPHLQFSWNKYGESSFTFTIILECPIDRLDEEEIRLIKEFETTNQKKGYNIVEGGNRPVITPETRLKMSLAKRGEKHPYWGKKRPPEVVEKMRQGNLGKKATTEQIEKLRESHLGQKAWNKGIPWSEEIKEKLSKAHIGQKPWNTGKSVFNGSNNPFYGKTHSEETKNKIRASLAKTRSIQKR